MPDVFKDSLDITIILEIFSVMKEQKVGNEEFIKNYLTNIPKIKRFDIGVSCLLKKEKLLIKEIIEHLNEKNCLEENEYKSLVKVYKL